MSKRERNFYSVEETKTVIQEAKTSKDLTTSARSLAKTMGRSVTSVYGKLHTVKRLIDLGKFNEKKMLNRSSKLGKNSVKVAILSEKTIEIPFKNMNFDIENKKIIITY